MVTKIKPRRMNASSSGSLGKDLAYQTESVFDRGVGGGDMKYADFGFQDLTGSTVTLDLSTEVTPTGNFVVVAPSEIKDGQQYILRVNNGATVYTMGLAGNTSNPYNIPLSLTANAIDQFVFLAVGGVLELQKNIDRVASVWGGITGTLSNQTDLQNALDDKQDELTPSTGISIDSSNNISNTLPGPRISSTAPSNPTEGMEWYDTTNDVLKVYDGSNWKIVGDDAANINVKAFYLSDTSDLTTAQAAYDRQNSGKNAIINLDGTFYYYYGATAGSALIFQGISLVTGSPVSTTDLREQLLTINYSSDVVSSVTTSYQSYIKVLDTNYNYTTPYQPLYNGSPATKKYVDDNVAELMGLGKFLSLRNGLVGQPISFPYTTPYAYTTGDYFLVEVVDPTTNYRPDGSSYTGTASSIVETDELEVGDVYIYDGSVWLLQSNHGKTVTFANIAGQPTDNMNLASALGAKADDNAVVKLTGDQTITGTKTFNTSPVVPSKTTDATNTGTVIATEAQVYKKQDTLVSGTNIKTINSTSLLGSGDMSISEFAPSNAGSTGDVLKKTAGGYEWGAAPATGIQNDTTGTTTTVTAIRCGTEAEYNSLGSYSASVIYHIY